MPGSLERIEQSLKWLKLKFDEGPTVGGNYGPYQQVHSCTGVHTDSVGGPISSFSAIK